ncbi:MAG: nucleotidyltransferase domain-containing protein [Pseudanabaena sp. ELA607]|jgi:predicted nucleotidyltransferase
MYEAIEHIEPKLALELPSAQIQAFCQRWQIQELYVFGSILRDDFGEHSDIDLLATFNPLADWSLGDRVRMELELSDFLQRPIDLLDREEVSHSPNWLRRKVILDAARLIYAQG